MDKKIYVETIERKLRAICPDCKSVDTVLHGYCRPKLNSRTKLRRRWMCKKCGKHFAPE